jgi:hypothetical protein
MFLSGDVMRYIDTQAGFPGRINSLSEVHNFSEFVEYVLPYGIAKVYMTANRRWMFLERDRRKRALALLINRVIRRFAFNIWDVRTSGGGFIEDFHTMPVIGIITILATEYARQENLINTYGNLNMATFKLCGEGLIPKELKDRIDRLNELKLRKERGNAAAEPSQDNKPLLYEEAVSALYELEECLISASRRHIDHSLQASA